MRLLPKLLIFILYVAFVSGLGVEPLGEKKKVVCYYGSWAVYRNGNGKCDVETLDPYICTHLIYTFAGLSANNTIESLDSYNDLEDDYGKGAFKRFTGLKELNPQLKTLLAIGGWNEGSEKYSDMASNPSERAKFVASVVNFLLEYNFDGLDFDWEYPSDRGGNPEDKVNFVAILSELKEAFAPYGFLLTAAVSAGAETINNAYDVASLGRLLDQIHLMAYDYHGSWEQYTGHHSALYSNPEIDLGDNSLLNQDFSVNYWLENGAPASKLILGIPIYGQGFILANPENHGLYATSYVGIDPGPYTGQSGFWGYNEICEKLMQDPTGWNIVVDSYYQAPYAYRGQQWIGYVDLTSARIKTEYAISKGLGGAMLWSAETDDLVGVCHGEPFPITKTVYETLNGPIVYPPTPTRGPTESTPTRATPTPSPSEVCQSAGYFRDPNDCAKYYQCVPNGDSWLVYYSECPPGTAFDPTTITCNYPELVPGCGN